MFSYYAHTQDPECCCCTRDLWVGCWGWCGDGSDSTPTLADSAPAFRAGEGALPGQVGGPCRGEYPLDEPTYPGNGAPRVPSDVLSEDCGGVGRRPGKPPRPAEGKAGFVKQNAGHGTQGKNVAGFVKIT